MRDGGRIAEGAGEDPFLGSIMASAYVRGYQGSRLDAPDSIAACAKHYVGYGAAEGGRDYNSTEISEHTLREFYLPPFHAAVDAGTASLMSTFNSLNGVPSTANPFTLKQIMRKEWGFRGLVVSDWSSIGELVPHGVAIDGTVAARKAFLAGVDMDMVSSVYHDHLQQLVSSRQVPLADVDDDVRHVLRVKLALGLFEHPFVDEAAAPKALYRPESIAFAQTAAERSFVLLKNTHGPSGQPVLPLASGVQNIAVIGPLAEDPSYPDGGTGRYGTSGVFALRAGPAIGRRPRVQIQGHWNSQRRRSGDSRCGRGRAEVGCRAHDVGRRPWDERRSGVKSIPGTSWPAGRIAGSYCEDWQAGSVDSLQRKTSNPSLGVRARARCACRVVSGNSERTGAGTNSFRRCKPNREIWLSVGLAAWGKNLSTTIL